MFPSNIFIRYIFKDLELPNSRSAENYLAGLYGMMALMSVATTFIAPPLVNLAYRKVRLMALSSNVAIRRLL